MSRISRCRTALAFATACLAIAVGASQPAAARQWRQTPSAAALEYTQIIDTRDKNLVFLWWIAAPAFHEPALDPLLKKYFILGVARARIDETTNIVFLDVEAPAVKSADGKTLKLIKDDDQPPTVVAVVAGLKSLASKLIGPMGNGMKLFVFEPGAVDACKPGKVSIPLDEEVYTYDTPIPGCPAP